MEAGEWKRVVVMGAAGKMGKGISLLLLQEMASMEKGELILLDTNANAFDGLKRYLRQHLLKYSEKNINQLRLLYQDRKELIDNEDMIKEFVERGLDKIRFVTAIEECQGATLVFEAIAEDVQVKSRILTKMKEVADHSASYFSNTSSIPIHILQHHTGLKGRLVGFHFYNPPAVQKLLEVIFATETTEGVRSLTLSLGKRLNKIMVFSHDIAGFIGNGHFIREIVGACSVIDRLQQEMPLYGAIGLVNGVFQHWLLRPMGLFQLIDYVGLDICLCIAKIMTEYLPNQQFPMALVEAMVSAGIKGGQHEDGSQKDGFFVYEKGKPVQVYDLDQRKYVPYEEKMPSSFSLSWKQLSQDLQRKEKLAEYFESLREDQSQEAKLAIELLEESRRIAHGLVHDGVASSIEDVDTVLQNGFFHLYSVA